jgi:DNA-binding transcriptional LysR family regulator
MDQKTEQVVTGMEHSDRANDLNWEDVRVFLRLSELKSFRAAAAELRVSTNALRRRISALEGQVNTILLARSARGVELTDEGERVRDAAQKMLQQARALGRLTQMSRPGLRTTVRVAATEGLGAFWLVPRLVGLFETAPNIQVDFRNEMRIPDVSSLEVDVAVQLDPPSDPQLKVVRLGWLHIALFASEEYIARHGFAENVADISRHKFIDLVAQQIPSEKLAEEVPDEDPRSFVGLRVNTASAQVLAATHGAGITALPTYARIVTHQLRHVARDYRLRRDIWLVYHPDAADFGHVRRTIDWIRASFDHTKYPWFQEDYVSPDEIDRIAQEQAIDTLFSGYRESRA